MRRINAPLLVALSTLALVLLAPSASATTIVPMSDRDLAVSTRAIVEGKVIFAEPLWDPRRRAVYTYVTVDVERVHKGDVPLGQIVLKQIGGRTERHETVVHGVPRLSRGTRALLFLNTDRDGALRVAHLALGHYEITFDAATGRDLATRSVDAVVLPRGASHESVTDVAFLDDLVASAKAAIAASPEEVARYQAARERVPVLVVPPEYVANAPSGAPHGSEFGFLNPGFRWFEPDSGAAVAIRVNGRRAPTVSKGVNETKAALAAWSNVAGSSLHLVYGGDANTAGRVEDGVSAVTFGDPGDELDDPVNCTGVIAAGGVTKAAPEYVTIDGKRFARILEGDVVVNDGFDCLLASCSLLAEIVTHELGHVLGFGHSSERTGESNAKSRDATMYFLAHLDFRGASLREDDSDAARFLYPGQSSSSEPLVLVTESLPEARTGERYEIYLSARGGAAPRTWSVVAGSLPTGMRLSDDGHLCGAPQSSGSATVSIRVRDAAGREEIREFGVIASNAPAPHISKAGYNPGSGKVKLSGTNLAADAEILINDAPIASGTRVRFKAEKGRLVAIGSPSKLGLRPKGQNTVAVVVAGQISNTVGF